MKIEKAKFYQGIILITIPFLLAGCIVGVLESRQIYLIIIEEFKPGFLKVAEFQCNPTGKDPSASDPSICYAKGHVIKLDLLDTGLYQKLNIGNEKNIDFTKRVYPVFYRNEGFPILRASENMLVLDKSEYKKDLFWTILIFFGLPLLAGILYYWLQQKINQHEKN